MHSSSDLLVLPPCSVFKRRLESVLSCENVRIRKRMHLAKPRRKSALPFQTPKPTATAKPRRFLKCDILNASTIFAKWCNKSRAEASDAYVGTSKW